VFNASDAAYSSTAVSEDFGEPVEVDIEVKGLMLTIYCSIGGNHPGFVGNFWVFDSHMSKHFTTILS